MLAWVVSRSQVKKGTLAKDRLWRRKRMYSRKYILACEMRACFSMLHRCVSRISIWPPRGDERPGVLISADGTWRSDWPGCVGVDGMRARSDR